MCRYAMHDYKPHFACFSCRKAFKRRLMQDISNGQQNESVADAKCPQCGGLMANMGKDFAAPKKDKVQAWHHFETLYEVGIAFHSCGCSGPGYIPKDREALVAHFQQLISEYHENLNYWRRQGEAVNKKEVFRKKRDDWKYINQISYTLPGDQENIERSEAIKFWIENIEGAEACLALIASRS